MALFKLLLSTLVFIFSIVSFFTYFVLFSLYHQSHGLRTPREEIAFTEWPKIQSQSQIFRYGGSIFCLPHRPDFSDIFDLCIHWVSVVRVFGTEAEIKCISHIKSKLDVLFYSILQRGF